MAINKNNSIRTNISIDSSGAQASITKLFNKIKKGQDDVASGTGKATAGVSKLGGTAATAGKAGGTGMGLLAKAMTAAKVATLSMIPALGGLTAAIAATGIGALIIAAAALIGTMIKAVSTGAKFGKALSALEAVSGSTAQEMAALSVQAKSLGASTAFTASEVVQLQTELAKLGFAASDIQNATPAILDLAASLNVDLAQAAEFAGSVVRSFGLETTDTQRVVDVLAKSASSSAQDFSSLVESFKLAAPTARALGVSIEETSALLGALANNGLKGSIAGTGLSKSFIMLHSKGLTLNEGLEKVRNSSDGLTTAINLVGIIGAKSLLTLANSGDDIESLNKKLANSAEGARGAAAAMAEIKLDNLSGDTTKLGSAWEGFLLSIEDGSGTLNDISRGAIQLLTSALSGLTTGLQYLDFITIEIGKNFQGFGGIMTNFLAGSFEVLGGSIKVFSALAQLAISKIPLIGRALDVDRIKADLANAQAVLVSGAKKIKEGVDALQADNDDGKSTSQRFKEFQEGEALKSAARKKLREDEKADAEASAKAAEEARKLKEKNAEEFIKFEQDLKKQQEDLDANTAEKKIELERQRQIAKLEALNQGAQAEAAALEALNAIFDQKQKERQAALKVIEDERVAKAAEVAAEKQLELDALELERLLLNDELTFQQREDMQLAYLEKKRLNELSNEKLTKEEIALIDKKAEKAKQKVHDAEEKAHKKLQDKVLDDALNGAAESFGIAQEVAVAKMIMAAPEAISGSFKEAAKAYAPPVSIAMGALGAAGVVAPIAKGLSDIKKARFGKKGVSGGGGGGGNISMPSASGGGFSGVATDAISDLAANNSARLGINPSIGGAAGSSAANNVMGASSNSVTFSEGRYADFQAQVKFRESLTSIGG